jgi:hypothetical protein
VFRPLRRKRIRRGRGKWESTPVQVSLDNFLDGGDSTCSRRVRRESQVVVCVEVLFVALGMGSMGG